MSPEIASGTTHSAATAERLVAELARRSRRRSATQKAVAASLGEELIAMGDAAVPALIRRLGALGETGCRTLARLGPRAFPALVEQLRAGPVHHRRLAALALELTGYAAAVDPLRHALVDPEPDVREAARRALEGLARTWVRRLRDGDRRDEAVRVLTGLREQAVWPLAHVLHDRHIGLFAARILGQIGEPAAPAALLVFAQARRSPDCEDWDPAFANATVALAAIGAPALDAVLSLLRDERELPNVRIGAAHVLSRMGDIATPYLVETLGHRDARPREAATAALERAAS